MNHCRSHSSFSGWWGSGACPTPRLGTRPRPAPKGIALVLVLAILVLAGVTLAGLSRVSLRQAVQTKQAEKELQTRWGIRSLRVALLPQAEAILNADETVSEKPIVTARRRITLGRQTFDLMVGDEQAKLNIGHVYQRADAATAERAVLDLTRTATLSVVPHLRPVIPREIKAQLNSGGLRGVEPPAVLGCWEQVFSLRPQAMAAGRHSVSERDLLHRALGDGGPLGAGKLFDHITLWGDGKLNFRRASPEVMRFTAASMAQGFDANRLLELRNSNPGMDADEALHQLSDTPTEQRGKAAALFTQGSRCHSLWIIARSPSPQGESGTAPELFSTVSRAESVVLIVQDEAAPRSKRPRAGQSKPMAVEYVFTW